MVKVLYVADMLHTKSGITAVIMNYYRHFDKSPSSNNLQIDFLLPEDSSEQRLLDEVSSNGSNVYFMPVLGASLSKIKRFKNFINSFFATHNDYTALHSHFMQLNALIFPVAKRYGIACTISHSHLTKYSENPLHSIRNWLMCLPNNRVSNVWAACGIKAGEFLYGKSFLSSPKHLLVHNAIELSKFAFNESYRKEIRDEFSFDDSIFLLGTIGRLQAQKNQDFLIPMMSKLVKKDSCYRLLIVGEGPLEDALKKHVHSLGLDDFVIFAGRRTDAYKIYQAFDMFVLPSIYEGLPVVGVEAQVAGLPCLFSDSVTSEIGLFKASFLPTNLQTNLQTNKKNTPWVEAICNTKKLTAKERAGSIEIVRRAGFDIEVEAKKLEDFYLKLSSSESSSESSSLQKSKEV